MQDIAVERKCLKNMELFVLDNSLRESTVGQLHGHTIENKWQIYNEVISHAHIYQLSGLFCTGKLCFSKTERSYEF